jgi:hypothetical protein
MTRLLGSLFTSATRLYDQLIPSYAFGEVWRSGSGEHHCPRAMKGAKGEKSRQILKNAVQLWFTQHGQLRASEVTVDDYLQRLWLACSISRITNLI